MGLVKKLSHAKIHNLTHSPPHHTFYKNFLQNITSKIFKTLPLKHDLIFEQSSVDFKNNQKHQISHSKKCESFWAQIKALSNWYPSTFFQEYEHPPCTAREKEKYTKNILHLDKNFSHFRSLFKVKSFKGISTLNNIKINKFQMRVEKAKKKQQLNASDFNLIPSNHIKWKVKIRNRKETNSIKSHAFLHQLDTHEAEGANFSEYF